MHVRSTRLVRAPFGLLLLAVALRAEESVNFNFDVLPILSDRCFLCHGTDPKHRKKDLRLDRRETALRVITPGDAEGSKLIRRIFSTDPDDVMPPPESHLELSGAERDVLKRWIAQGAEYRGHWAYLPIARPAASDALNAPAVASPPAGREIDTVVAARLARDGLSLQPTASPERLLRRLSFDLTGLPPTIAELDAFTAEAERDLSAAVATAVDRLLASPHFGERMAADWLDVARFADTFGYQSDVTSPVWPYRDWVLKAFNENLAFDQFITWQLAGDLLPNPSRDQHLATAFNRLHRQTNEGGSINEEFRVEYVNDRVETFGMAFLGLTLQCAKCHDHKYDPVTQRDYYSLFAYFQNIDESGLYSHFTDAIPTPTLRLTTPQQDIDRVLAEAQVATAEARLATLRDDGRPAFDEWLKGAAAGGELVIPDEIGHFSFDEIKDGKVANSINPQEPGVIFDDVAAVDGRIGRALQLSGEDNVNFALGGSWTRDDAFSIALWIRTPDVKDRAVVLHRSKAWTDAASNGYELLIEDGRLSAALIHFWPGNALRIVTRAPLPVNAWTHVVWSYDGSSRARGLKLFVNGAEADVDVVRDALTKDINRGGENRLTIGQRFRDRGFKGGAVDDLRLFTRALTPLEAAYLGGHAGPAPDDRQPAAEPRWPAADLSQLADYHLSAIDPVYRAHLAELRGLRQRRSAVVDPVSEIMTMREMAEPKPAFVLFRGAYDQRRERVTARTPEFLPPPPAGAPANRLGLARWVVSPENPLPARVIVNRLWQSFFGRGLVGTPEDFGLQGAMPTHPELLDFLARRFIDSGWDFKALVRVIVSSHSYQQASECPPAVRALDPENRLLSRGPSFRLSAEQIRDQALVAAGQLDPALGGPSVDPDHSNRRSLYTFWKRTMPDVRMEIFDMAKREVCTARRPLTNTPLQALTLLNEARFNGWARQIASQASTDPDLESALTAIFRRLTSRRPTNPERAILHRLYDEQAAESGQSGSAAHAAALMAVAQTVMNFDESAMKR